MATRRIDLYKRDCFVLEAKQSRQKQGGEKEVRKSDLFATEAAPRGRRGAERAWDVLMMNARRQAEDYVHLLPAGHEPPPFIIVSDVGHCFEVYANFRRDGKAYDQFPDRQSFRVYLEDLRKPEVRDRLVSIWTDPMALDPAKRSARVTRDIAERLAAVSKALEADQHPPEEVAMFLMRCLFTMFAEDVGLLPEKAFKEVLERCEADPETFPEDVGQLWEATDLGGYAHAIRKHVPQFNGEFFRSRTVLPLAREEIGELRQAASYDWRDVEPAIFGTLLEQALDAKERRRLGAHYTPRSYVERLVVATIIEPLRDDWNSVLSTAERQKGEGRKKDAIATVRAFHKKLCETRVLDPACGTGNFLYVSLELLKRLEGEVLEALVDLGGQEALSGLGGHTVDPHQFLGLEINPRAAAIAELVLWIGHLQWHVRTKGGKPSEPILRAFKNVSVQDAVLAPERPNIRLRKPLWPGAEFIVGNPPFIGSKFMRGRLGDLYTETLWAAHPQMNQSADFVMFWWDHCAELLNRRGTVLRRFGLVTTNSITQSFQSRVVDRYLKARRPVSLVMAIPDHPWTKATPDSASVRIAMTVVEAGEKEGVLFEVTAEEGLDTDAPIVELRSRKGIVNADLTIGVDVTTATSLTANAGVCSPGVKLHGAGFIITPAEAAHLGLGRRVGLDKHIRQYLNGRDLTSRPRGVMVIDLYGLDIDEVRRRFPEVYQHVKSEVKEKIIVNEKGVRELVGRDWNNRQSYRDRWWVFGEPREEIRPALSGLKRFIATPVTQKHRTFEFVSSDILPDDALMVIADEDAYCLGVLHSRAFLLWFQANSSTLEDRPRFIKSRCFDPFPFPATDELQKHRIRLLAEELDGHRKRVLSEHPQLTLTSLYNVLSLLRGGVDRDQLDDVDRRTFDDGLVLILSEIHEKLDAAVIQAYGWRENLGDAEILTRLVALNKERSKEETRGLVRWLRPEYQVPRFGSPKEKAELDLAGVAPGQEVEAAAAAKPSFPSDDVAQTAAVMSVLAVSEISLGTESVATSFRQGRRNLAKVEAVMAALARMGFLNTADGGKTFALRRGV